MCKSLAWGDSPVIWAMCEPHEVTRSVLVDGGQRKEGFDDGQPSLGAMTAHAVEECPYAICPAIAAIGTALHALLNALCSQLIHVYVTEHPFKMGLGVQAAACTTQRIKPAAQSRGQSLCLP